MKIVVQLIESYLKQQIPTIIITIDQNKYLFNIPSSFQRFTRENKIKLPSMANYFFTKSATSTITGLTGLLLTLHQKGDNFNSKLYLDQKLFNYMEELRYKMGFKVVPISYCSWEGKSRRGINNSKKVSELFDRPDSAEIFNNIEAFITNQIPQNEQNNALKQCNQQQKCFQNKQIKIIPFQIQSKKEQITNFIVVPNQLPGKILIDKLKSFGIKGAAISELTKNGKITVNGRLILLQQVKQPDSPSPNVIILHYNSLESIAQIVKNQIFKNYLQNPLNFTYCVIHVVEQPNIITSNEFKFMLSLFSNTVQHLVYNRQYRNSTDQLQSLLNLSFQVQLVSKLSKTFPLCMPNLEQIHLDFIKKFVGNTEAIDLLFPEYKVTAYKKCYQMVVCPKKSWGYKSIYHIKKQKTQDQIQDFTFNEEIELDSQIKQKLSIIDPKIVFLGTGSMKPSKYRNVSSILVQFGQAKMLLDCGEGSHIQIAQHFGYNHYENILLEIRTIFITHIHSDHNLGILDLISQRNQIINKRGLNKTDFMLYLVLPANVVPWFESFCQNIENLKEVCEVIFIQSLRNEEFTFVGTMSKENMIDRKCSAKSDMVDQSEENQQQEDEDQLDFIKPEWEDILLHYGQMQKSSLQNFKGYLQSIGIVQFHPSPVFHCPQSYGIIIKHFSGIKISYSGDTRPCNSFAQDAANSTIMIHEATFGDDLANNAFSHFHSTVGEAIDIGMKSKSWKTALTHFSQRYKSSAEIVQPKMYKANKQKQQYAEKHTIVCFDHLQMNVSQAHIMPYYSRGVANAIPKDNKE